MLKDDTPVVQPTVGAEKRHSPEQLKPFPVYPTLQAQVKLPGVLVQRPNELQPPLFAEHSLISEAKHSFTVFYYG